VYLNVSCNQRIWHVESLPVLNSLATNPYCWRSYGYCHANECERNNYLVFVYMLLSEGSKLFADFATCCKQMLCILLTVSIS
jgi:hypothetical protein